MDEIRVGSLVSIVEEEGLAIEVTFRVTGTAKAHKESVDTS